MKRNFNISFSVIRIVKVISIKQKTFPTTHIQVLRFLCVINTLCLLQMFYTNTHTAGVQSWSFSAVLSNMPCRHTIKIPFPSYKSLILALPWNRQERLWDVALKEIHMLNRIMRKYSICAEVTLFVSSGNAAGLKSS